MSIRHIFSRLEVGCVSGVCAPRSAHIFAAPIKNDSRDNMLAKTELIQLRHTRKAVDRSRIGSPDKSTGSIFIGRTRGLLRSISRLPTGKGLNSLSQSLDMTRPVQPFASA